MKKPKNKKQKSNRNQPTDSIKKENSSKHDFKEQSDEFAAIESDIESKSNEFISGESSAITNASNAPISESVSENNNPESTIRTGWCISLFLTAIFGLVITIYLTIHHYRLMSGLPDYQSFCSVSEVIDCDMVNSSSYSEFKGLPIALFGAGVYAAIISLLILSVFARGAALGRYMSVITLMGVASFGFSLYLAYVSSFILRAVCILCVITYFINLFMFLGSRFAVYGTKWLSSPVKTFVAPFVCCCVSKGDVSKIRLPQSAIWNVAAIFAIVMIVLQGFFAAIYLDAKYLGFTEKDINDFMAKYKSVQVQEIDLTDSPYWGTANPDLTIVVFEDYLCDFCKRAHITTFPIFREFKDRIKIVFKHLPYDKDCNPSLQKTIHPGACQSSIAAACASLQGEFERFQEYFFSHQDVIKPEMDIIKLAEQIGGVDLKAFDQCLKQGRGEWLVRKDFKEAMRLEVSRTPAYFFNGRKWEGALKPIFIKRILDFELRQ